MLSFGSSVAQTDMPLEQLARSNKVAVAPQTELQSAATSEIIRSYVLQSDVEHEASSFSAPAPGFIALPMESLEQGFLAPGERSGAAEHS